MPTNPAHKLGGYRIDEERRDLVDATSLSFDLSQLARAATNIPDELNLANKLRRDQQGGQNACGSHAATCVGEGLHLLKRPAERPQFSRQYQYIGAQSVDGLVGSDAGSTIDGNVRWAKETGFCLETLWPYTGQYHVSPPVSRRRCDTDARGRRVQFHRLLTGYEQCWQFLSTGLGFIILGIDWNDSIPSNGLIDRYDPNYARGESGGHALAFMGWKKQKQGRWPLLDMWNWWPEWGDRNGNAAVTPDVVDFWCRSGTVVGLSNLSVPAVRKLDWTSLAYNDETTDYYDKLRSQS